MISWHKRWGNPEPVCPHCGAVNGDASDLDLQNDGDETTTECGSCSKEFTVQLALTVDYHTKGEGQTYDHDPNEKEGGTL